MFCFCFPLSKRSFTRSAIVLQLLPCLLSVSICTVLIDRPAVAARLTAWTTAGEGVRFPPDARLIFFPDVRIGGSYRL